MTLKYGDKVRYTGQFTSYPRDTIYEVSDYDEKNDWVDAGFYYSRDNFGGESGSVQDFELVYDYDFKEIEIDGLFTRDHVYVNLMFDKNTGLFVADREAYEEWMEKTPSFKIVRE